MDDEPVLPLRPNVCMLIFNRDGKLFLGERAGAPGIWQFPQGGVDEGQSLEENVYRELNEELGVSRELLSIRKQLTARHEYNWDNPPGYAIGKWRGQSQTFWVVDFLGSDNDIILDTHTQEFMSWRWAAPGDILTLVEPRRREGYMKALQELLG